MVRDMLAEQNLISFLFERNGNKETIDQNIIFLKYPHDIILLQI